MQPLDPSSLKVHWGIGSFTDSLTLTPTGNPNEYSASIPGPLNNVDVRYYIIASDINGGTSTASAGRADLVTTSFHVGADVEAAGHRPHADRRLPAGPVAADR